MTSVAFNEFNPVRPIMPTIDAAIKTAVNIERTEIMNIITNQEILHWRYAGQRLEDTGATIEAILEAIRARGAK